MCEEIDKKYCKHPGCKLNADKCQTEGNMKRKTVCFFNKIFSECKNVPIAKCDADDRCAKVDDQCKPKGIL